MSLLRNKIPFLLSIFLLISCSKKDTVLSTSLENSQTVESKQLNYVIKGKAEFQSFKIKVDNSTQFATRATVSLLYPHNYSNVPLRNTVIATGLSDANGNFIINPESNFSPQLNQVYILEASKRFYGVANPLVSLRTYIMWNGSTWKSITKPDISINKKTTTITIHTELNPTIINPNETIDRIDNNANPVTIQFDSKMSEENYGTLLPEIEASLVDGKDPVAFFRSLPQSSLIQGQSRAKNSSVKANAQTLQTTLETYAVDWGGQYPSNVSNLKLDGNEKGYYRNYQNPFGNLFPGEQTLDYSEYEQAKNTLIFKGNPIESKVNLRGYVVCELIQDNISNFYIKYFIYGVDYKGDLIQDRGVDFYLTNN